MINEKLIKDEKLLNQLKQSIINYKKVSQEALTEGFSPDDLSSKQISSLENFAKLYGRAADEMVRDAKKVESTIKDAANGAGNAFRSQLDLIDDG